MVSVSGGMNAPNAAAKSPLFTAISDASATKNKLPLAASVVVHPEKSPVSNPQFVTRLSVTLSHRLATPSADADVPSASTAATDAAIASVMARAACRFQFPIGYSLHQRFP